MKKAALERARVLAANRESKSAAAALSDVATDAKARSGIAYCLHPSLADTRESRAFRRMQNQYHLGQDYIVLNSSSSSKTDTESGKTTRSSAAVRRAQHKERARLTRHTSRRELSDVLAATTSCSPSSPRKAGPLSVLIKWQSAGPAAQSRSLSPAAV